MKKEKALGYIVFKRSNFLNKRLSNIFLICAMIIRITKNATKIMMVTLASSRNPITITVNSMAPIHSFTFIFLIIIVIYEKRGTANNHVLKCRP